MGLFTALIEESLSLLHQGVDSVTGEITKLPDNHRYKSEFIRTDDLLSSGFDGFCMDGTQCLSITAPHCMVTGSSGSGKTSTVVIPGIYKSNQNMIINDPSHEIYARTSSLLLKRGYEVCVINFSNSSVSSGFNVLHRITDKSDSHKIAQMFVRAVLHGSKDPFWNLQGSAIIALVIQVQLYHDIRYRNLSNTLHLLQQLSFNPKLFDTLILQTGSQQLINEYKHFLSYDVKLRTSILATAVSALQIFNDPEVAKVTARDTLRIDDIRKGKRAIYIHCNISDTTYYSVLVSIFFEQMCKLLMARLPERGDSYVQIILDEFASMHLPSIQTVISNVRKYLGNILLLCQDYGQIEHIYGARDAQAIRNNCIAKLYMAGLSYPVAKDISQELGRYEYTHENKHQVRDLLSPDEVRTISADEALLIYGNAAPMRLKLRPYYANPMMRRHLETNTIRISGEAQYNDVSLIGM